MKLPEVFLQSLEGVAGFEREAFVAVHEREEGITSIRINPAKWTPASMGNGQWSGESERSDSHSPFTIAHSRFSPVPWS
ncbi:MAG TPA: hypothetical protein VFT06_12985, partial [Flavisolibacter sp.]|nr:hypothetical protein [Flavisolibacter sp.]